MSLPSKQKATLNYSHFLFHQIYVIFWNFHCIHWYNVKFALKSISPKYNNRPNKKHEHLEKEVRFKHISRFIDITSCFCHLHFLMIKGRPGLVLFSPRLLALALAGSWKFSRFLNIYLTKLPNRKNIRNEKNYSKTSLICYLFYQSVMIILSLILLLRCVCLCWWALRNTNLSSDSKKNSQFHPTQMNRIHLNVRWILSLQGKNMFLDVN